MICNYLLWCNKHTMIIILVGSDIQPDWLKRLWTVTIAIFYAWFHHKADKTYKNCLIGAFDYHLWLARMLGVTINWCLFAYQLLQGSNVHRMQFYNLWCCIYYCYIGNRMFLIISVFSFHALNDFLYWIGCYLLDAHILWWIVHVVHVISYGYSWLNA